MYDHTENLLHPTSRDDEGRVTSQVIVGARDVARNGQTLGAPRLYDKPLPACLDANGTRAVARGSVQSPVSAEGYES